MKVVHVCSQMRVQQQDFTLASIKSRRRTTTDTAIFRWYGDQIEISGTTYANDTQSVERHKESPVQSTQNRVGA